MNEWHYGDCAVPRPLHYVSDPVYAGLTVGFMLGAILVLLYAFRLSRRLGTSYPIWTCVGACVAAFYEPVGDLFANLSYFQTHAYFIHSYGNTVPVFLPPGYMVFFGLPILYLIGRIEMGIDLKRWMSFYCLVVVAAAIFELPFIAVGVHKYFGERQPAQLLGYPLWMPFVNATSMFLAAALAYAATKLAVVKRQPAWYALMVPFSVAGAGAFLSLPIGLAINSSASALVVNLGAIGSITLSVLGVWFAGNVVCQAVNGGARQPGVGESGALADSS